MPIIYYAKSLWIISQWVVKIKKIQILSWIAESISLSHEYGDLPVFPKILQKH